MDPNVQPQPIAPQPVQQYPAQPPSSKPFFTNPIFLILAFVVVAIIASFGTYFVLQSKTQKPTPVTSSPTPLPSKASATEGTVDPTANWKTYINEFTGISFKYPPQYNIALEIGNGVTFATSSSETKYIKECMNTREPQCEYYSLDINLQRDEKTKNKTIKDFINTFRENSITYKQTTLNGYNAYEKEFEKDFTKYYQIMLETNSYFYAITTSSKLNSSENIDTFKKMLPTFKFTDQNISPSPKTVNNLPKEKCGCWDSINNICLSQSACL